MPSTAASGSVVLIEALDRAIAAAADAGSALDDVTARLSVVRTKLVAGESLSEVLAELVRAGGLEARRAPAAAFTAYEQALSAFRAELFRGLIAGGRTFSEIGAMTGVSRQVVARLYRSVDDLP